MAEEGTVAEETVAPEIEVEAGNPAETASVEEGATSTEKPLEPEQEKKFTDADMKGLRKSYQAETRRERDARIAAETEARVLREMIAGQKKEDVSTPVVSDRPIRPQEGDFQTREEYNRAMNSYEDSLQDWREKSRAAATTKDAETKRVEEERAAIDKIVRTQVDAGRKSYKDFDDVVVNNPEFVIPVSVNRALLDMDNGHDVAYYLATHPEDRQRLIDLGNTQKAVIEAGRISAKLEKKPAPAAVVQPQTKAPKPAATVGGKKPSSTDTTLEGKTQEERMRLIELAARERRLKRQ